MLSKGFMQKAILLLPALCASSLALDNGFGRTPVLGFNTYNDVDCSPNSSYVYNTIDALVSKKLLAAGYKYFQIDCGWQGYQRLENGSITYDETVFPTGIKPLSDYAISKGFQWSMYTDQGVYACDNTGHKRLGSLGYEQEDALMMKAWNTVYVKVDNCYVTPDNIVVKDPSADFVTRYGAMSDALRNQSIDGMLVCQWGVPYQAQEGLQGPAQWTPQVATSFRVSDDIAKGWNNVQRIMNEAINVNVRNLSGPGNFADMDLLEVGNDGMTVDEQKSHFAIWSMFKSALMISTDVPNISDEALEILTNQDLLMINQDPLGVPVTLVQRFGNDHDLFSGPLENGDRAVLAVDQSGASRKLPIDFADFGVSTADVKDLWTGSIYTGLNSYSADVASHGSLALRLSNIIYEEANTPAMTSYEAESAQLSGGADVQSCSGCSGGQKLGNIQSGASATLTGIKTSQETSNVLFDYVNCEVGYLNNGENVRRASISVNDGPAQEVAFPLSGYDWSQDVYHDFLVRLSGFDTSAENTITITGQNGPDFDRITVIA